MLLALLLLLVLAHALALEQALATVCRLALG
jgi:hypothetical protein